MERVEQGLFVFDRALLGCLGGTENNRPAVGVYIVPNPVRAQERTLAHAMWRPA